MIQMLAFVVVTAAAWFGQDGDPLQRAIADLGHEKGAVREAALQSLMDSGLQAVPYLQEALLSQDVEVRQRATLALSTLEQERRLAGVLRARPAITLSFQDVPFARALEDVALKTGIRFEGAGNLPDRRVTASFTRAPLMQVLDVLAAAAEREWSFDGDGVVSWRSRPPARRPSCYTGGFRTSVSRIDAYRSWDYQQGVGLVWLHLETRTEPGIHPLGLPRIEVCEVTDDAGNVLPGDSVVQECFPKKDYPEAGGRDLGAIYLSNPFRINPLAGSVKKLSKISGRAIFMFPLDPETVELNDLCEGTSATRGKLEFRVSEILTSSLKLTLTSSANSETLGQHVDVSSLVLIDSEGRTYGPGTDFDVCGMEVGDDALCYCVTFNEGVSFQPVALRFRMTGQFLEKSVPFEFKDVPLP